MTDRKALSTRDVAGLISATVGPARDWQIRLLADRGEIPRPLTIGRYRVFSADDVPLIVAAMRRRGWLPAGSEVASA